jgi:DNA-directed RNA polymerase alpha subunit
VQKGDDGIRGTRSELGTRYAVNLGCLFALEATPTSTALDIVRNLSIKRFSEFGKDHAAYAELQNTAADSDVPDMLKILEEQLGKSVDCLDISDYQNEKLKEAGFNAVGDVIRAPEHLLMEKIFYVGEKRARRIKNAAEAAVLEYLSG